MRNAVEIGMGIPRARMIAGKPRLWQIAAYYILLAAANSLGGCAGKK